ncbi:MAG: hypothetical protein WCA85_26380 [Paraburkholderia sp.]|uniref:hypothetical protein n=1 Tax=Paraburkholderia sp. TaxID=1926495 RepID=UPI003C343373
MLTAYKSYVYEIDINRVGDEWCAIGRVGRLVGTIFVSTAERSKHSRGSALTLSLALEKELQKMIEALV